MVLMGFSESIFSRPEKRLDFFKSASNNLPIGLNKLLGSLSGLGQQADGILNRKDFMPKFKLYKKLQKLFFFCKMVFFKILG